MKHAFRLLLQAFVFIAVLLSAVQILGGGPDAPAQASAICSGSCVKDSDCVGANITCDCNEAWGTCQVW